MKCKDREFYTLNSRTRIVLVSGENVIPGDLCVSLHSLIFLMSFLAIGDAATGRFSMSLENIEWTCSAE